MKDEKDIYKFSKEEHIHILNGSPMTGTSSIGNVLAKNLTWWAAELSAVECLESGEKIETIRQEYEEAVESGNKKEAIDALQRKYPIFKKARFAHFNSRNKSAKSGTDLHEILERWVKSEMGKGKNIDITQAELIKPFIEWSKENVKKFIASEAHCYSKELWVGGIVDAVVELNDGTLAVIDFKSSKAVYITHYIQTSLYAIEIDENGLFSSDGEHQMKLDKKIGALIVVAFGAEVVKPEIRTQIDKYKKGAEAAVLLYRLMDLDALITGKK